jgi:TolB-like protein/Flp pilus assembly protein TadD
MTFFAELKRRNVFRVGAAYLVVSWLLLQVIDVVAPILELPEWAPKLALAFISIGFLPALIFAWAFEITPEGVKREKDVDRSRSITSKTGQKLNRVIIGVLVLIILLLVTERSWTPNEDDRSPAVRPEPAPAPQEPALAVSAQDAAAEGSIAVLPFINRSAGLENSRFFSDGIHDDLLTNLSKIRDLKVISRTSMMAYRDTTKNMRQIGAELGVANVLEGGVQQAGDRVRINVQLISAQTDEHLWAETYDRGITAENIFEIQGEIARAIAQALKATLTPEEEDRGRFDAINRSLEFARKAIRLDPGYPDAHLALALALTHSVNTGINTQEESGEEIIAAIDTAMLLKPDYHEAWSALGNYQTAIGDPGAEKSLEQAMRLNPGNAQTLHAFGRFLRLNSRPREALTVLLRSSELDPLSVNVLFGIGRTHEVLGAYDEAHAAFARIREIDPSSPLGYGPNAGAYMSQGQLDQAAYWLRKAQQIDPMDFELGGWIVSVYDSLEDYEAAQRWSEWLDGWVTNQPQPMAMQAKHHYMTGNFEVALQYANLALKLGLENRWNSDSIFMRIKRDEALASGNPEAGIRVFAERHPALFNETTEITPDNTLQAVDAGLLLSLAGRKEQARRLLHAVITAYEQPWFATGSDRLSVVTAKAQALAILGHHEDALDELSRVIDNGWLSDMRWVTDLNANFNGLRESPRFKAILAELEAVISDQRARARAMAERGEIKPPPAADSRRF